MIKIFEHETKKCPGLTSLFIDFPYNKQLVDIVKKNGSAIFDKKTSMWELPTYYLQSFLDDACTIDDIELSILPDENKPFINYQLQKYKIEPFNHQVEGVQYGLNKPRWLLLDPPGLGKTFQLTMLACELKRLHNIEHCLVICGINALKFNWIREINKYTDLPAVILGQKINKKGNIVIGSVNERIEHLNSFIDEFFVVTNIETLRNSDVVKLINKGPNKFDCIFLDEAHVCKSVSSQQGSNLMKLDKATYRVAATGTLILNNPLDAYVPLKWIGVEHACHSEFEYFYYRYDNTISRNIIGYKNTADLKDQLDNYSLRREPDVVKLPSKNVISELVEMEPKQKEFYNNIVNGVVSQVDKVRLKPNMILAMTTRLRQATACPSVLTTENIPCAKIDRAVDLASQIVSSGEKVAIFSTFKETAYIIAERLKYYKPLICTGDTKSDAEVDNNVHMFQTDNEHMIMVATISKLSVGQTLNRACYSILVDLPWTAAATEQCDNRIWRIGSTKPCFIYHLCTKDTIDERVEAIVNRKGAISGYIVDNEIPEESYKELQRYIEDLSKS